MAYIPPEVVAQAKQMDLLTYLKNYEPEELVHFSGDTYCTRTHDSLKISNGKWCWFSRGIGGRSALDYLIKVNGYTFTQAVERIMGQAAIQPPVFVYQPKKEQPKALELPKASRCATHVVSYLRGRGIGQELIDYCFQTGRLYESVPYHNAVFLGMDRDGNARYANLRGIHSDFKGEAPGSDKRFSFNIPPAQGSTTLHLFESAIDLLSYATLEMLDGRDWHRDHLLSLAGVYQPKKEMQESSTPLALKQYLSDHPEVKNIDLRLDNDGPGRLAIETLQTILPKDYTVTPQLPPKGKDYNDTVKMRLGLYRRKEEWTR